MMNYIFKTITTMKEYNRSKWWIDSKVVPEIKISATNVQKALKQYRELVRDRYYIDISNTAIRTKSPMYVDTKSGKTKQVGYVITGKYDFEDEKSGCWVPQYIDLWVEILTVTDTDFGKAK